MQQTPCGVKCGAVNNLGKTLLTDEQQLVSHKMLYAVHEQDILVTIHVAELEHLDSLVGKTSYEASAALLAGVLLRLSLMMSATLIVYT